jgi:alkylated DNA repair dioxygenase AlkB
MMERKHIDSGGILDYDPEFLSKEESNSLFESLKKNIAWEQKFATFGTKVVAQPRLTAWYADDPGMKYSYSGVTQQVQPWTPELLELKKKIEAVAGWQYNSVLLNFYRDGTDSVGFHADNEKELGLNPNIASVSLGTTRSFLLVRNGNPELKLEYQLTHGSLLIMSGTTQKHWKHSIPKALGLKDGRINLTFRTIYV